MAIQNAQPLTSIYMTFKILQIINQLRRRLKPRVQSDRTKADTFLGPKTRLGLEDDAFRGFKKCISLRVSGLDAPEYRNAHDRVRKSRKGNRSSLKPLPLGRDCSGPLGTSKEKVQRILQDIDGEFSPPKNALSKIAADSRLFIERNNDPRFDDLSLRDIARCLALVHDAIDTLDRARSEHGDHWLICQGNEIGLRIDETFIANYGHLLLRLRNQLIQTFIRKAIEWLEADARQGYGKKQRNLLSWFSEFPDNHRPISTTWPWSIKPSLAVLWGVCWMFYGAYPQTNSSTDDNDLSGNYPNAAVSQRRFIHDQEAARWIGWDLPRPDEYLQYGLEATAAQPQGTQRGGDVGSVGSVRGGQTSGPPLAGSRANLSEGRHVNRLPSARPGPAAQPHLIPQAGHSQDRLHNPIGEHSYLDRFSGPTHQPEHQYNSYALTSHASPDSAPAQAYSWPENQGIATPSLYSSQLPSDVDGVGGTWPFSQHTQHSPVNTELPHQRHRSSSHLTVPDIRLTLNDQAADEEGLTAPQYPFARNIYDAVPSPPQALPQQTLNGIRVNTNLTNINSMGNFGPEKSPIQQQNMPAQSNHHKILSPVSMSGQRSPVFDRRSSHSSLQEPRADSEGRSTSPEEVTGSSLSPRRGHAYKRAEDPPRNAQNKMVCKFKECANLTFERKCEWSKHMDKHDRPYKCHARGCEKLQGFTYSGGLLRHEREVHKLHGGTKKSLFCPHGDCKRSSGAGFTRKENLAEHIRRVHRRVSASSDTGLPGLKREDERDEVESPEDLREEEPQGDDGAPGKRKRISNAVELINNGNVAERDEGDLRAEVKRLRRENEEKDERLRQLEAAVARLQQQR